MAEAPGTEPVPSSSEPVVVRDVKDPDEPLSKKAKIVDKETSDKLEHRLGGILCCAVCLDLPQAAVYQCSNGHLMCAPCFTHLLADARLRDESATCPNCRVEISRTTASRNLAVEKTVSELPSECKYCTRVFPRHSLHHHEENICEERQFKFSQIVVDSCAKSSYVYGLVRIVSRVYWTLVDLLRASAPRGAFKRRRPRRVTGCGYSRVGCGWRGPAHEAGAHERACEFPHKAAADVLPTLLERDRRDSEENALYSQILDLLSFEKITFNDLQLKPYRTEEFVHKLYYESSRFSAFGHQWVVKAFVNRNERDPTQSSARELTYQLVLKSKPLAPLSLQWVPLRGPFGEAALRPALAHHVFGEGCTDAGPQRLPLAAPADVNRLLASKAIHFRLIMFLSSK